MKTDYSKYPNIEKVPAGACKRYWDCGNITPGKEKTSNELCNECIDWMRDQDSEYNVSEMNTTRKVTA